MAMSKEERLKRKRIAEKKRREKINANPLLLSEEQKKRRERDRRRGKKKLSAKQKIALRKKWRLNKRKYNAKKKEEKALTAAENPVPASSRAESMRAVSKRRAKCKRMQQYLAMKKLKMQVAAAENRVSKYKMRYLRLKKVTSDNSTSPQSSLNRELKKDKINVSPEVRRQLLFGKAIEADLKESFSHIKSTKTQHMFSSKITLKNIQKYRLSTSANSIFKFRSFQRDQKNEPRPLGKKCKHMMRVAYYVQQFFEDDENSAFSPARDDQIVRNKTKKQKRFLTNSMKYLFLKFSERSPYFVSYSRFCKLQPFWVVTRPVGKRDTCLCVKCENPCLMCQQLSIMNIVSKKNIDTLLETEMCCERITEACRFRECEHCRDKDVVIADYIQDEECSYYSWITKVERGRDQKERRHTGKERLFCSTHDLVIQFKEAIVPYMKHIGNWLHQSRIIKQVKANLTDEDLLLHIDFAENYACKYSLEIQAIHFGGNRGQISLHTGVLYHANQVQSFCTASMDTDHTACAIFTHLEPILQEHRHNLTIQNLYFVSDSPSTQYRNKNMFYILKHKIIPLFQNLQKVMWLYTESGHGKGLADGVGAAIKDRCDDVVRHGGDVANFDQFKEAVQELNIKIVFMESVQNANLIKEVADSSKAVQGSMTVHQVQYFFKEKNFLFFNSLACLDCVSQCTHFHVMKVDYKPKDASHEEDDKVIDESNPNNLIDEGNPNDFKEEQWVIVRFTLEQGKGERKWIGKILRVNENKTFLITFVRAKESKFHSGFLYVYPPKADEYTVYKTQLIQSIPPPEKFQRRLLFSIHSDDLKK